MTPGKHRREYQHVSSSGMVALEKLCKGLDCNSAAWPTAPWHVFRADDRCCSGRVFLQLCCLSLQRAFLDCLYFPRLSLHREREKSHGRGLAWDAAVILLGCLVLLQGCELHSYTTLTVIRAPAGQCCWGQKPLTPLPIHRKNLPFIC